MNGRWTLKGFFLFLILLAILFLQILLQYKTNCIERRLDTLEKAFFNAPPELQKPPQTEE